MKFKAAHRGDPDGVKVVEVDAEPIDIEGVPCYLYNGNAGDFINADGDWWHVCELASGYSIGNASLRDNAIAIARAKVQDLGVSKIKAMSRERGQINEVPS